MLDNIVKDNIWYHLTKEQKNKINLIINEISEYKGKKGKLNKKKIIKFIKRKDIDIIIDTKDFKKDIRYKIYHNKITEKTNQMRNIIKLCFV